MLDLPALEPAQPPATTRLRDGRRPQPRPSERLRFGPPGVARPVRSRSRSPTSAARASRGLPADAPITYAGQPARRIVALARPVGALKDGDILTAHSEMQVDATELVRSDVNCNVGVATRLFLSPDPDSLDDAVAIGNEAVQLHRARRADDQDARARGRAKLDHGSPRPGLRPADVRAAAAVDDRQLRLRRVQERHRGRPRPSGQLHAWSATGPRRTPAWSARPPTAATTPSWARVSTSSVRTMSASTRSRSATSLPATLSRACPRCRLRRPTTARPFTAPSCSRTIRPTPVERRCRPTT